MRRTQTQRRWASVSKADPLPGEPAPPNGDGPPGAKCDVCPLRDRRDGGPVYAELNAVASSWRPTAACGGKRVLLIAQSPGKFEIEFGAPMRGPFGAEAIKAIGRAAGGVGEITRKTVSWTNVVACRYPEDDPVKFNGKLRAENRRRVTADLDPLPTPEACCAPRLAAEVAQHDAVVAFGGEALRAVGVDEALRVAVPTLPDFAGFPTVGRLPGRDGKPVLLLPTEAAILREAKLLPLFRQDILKAGRQWRGELNWTDPAVAIKPTAAQIMAFFAAARRTGVPVVVDVESAPVRWKYAEKDGKLIRGEPSFDPLYDLLRCVGLYAPGQGAIVIPWWPVDGQTFRQEDGTELCTWYTLEEYAEVGAALIAGLIDDGVTFIGQNVRYYDLMVLLQTFREIIPQGATLLPVCVDTHPLHKLADSDLRHGLAMQARIWTDVGPWKSEHAATDARSDEELYRYNGRDLKVNHLIAEPCRQRVIRKAQIHLESTYQGLQDACVGMHRLGMHVDEVRRQQHEDRVRAEVARWEREINGIIPDAAKKRAKGGEPAFNPNSTQQLSALLYRVWDLPVFAYTDSGDPSTGDETLRTLLLAETTPPEVVAFLTALRRYRKYRKILTTYLLPWKPGRGYVVNGVLRPDWNACGTVGWRFASGDPNVQNVPNEYLVDRDPDGKAVARWSLRDIFVAPEGYCLIGADMDQLELRLAAAIAGAGYYLDAFERNTIDPHNLTGELIYGEDYYAFEGAPTDRRKKGDGKFKETRDLVKRFVYAALYGALPPTIRGIIAETEDDTGKLIYADLMSKAGLSRITGMRRRWMARAPEFERWWEETLSAVARDGYLSEPISGLRRYFHSTSTPNEMINFRVQAGGGKIVHDGTFDLIFGGQVDGPRRAPPIPFDYDHGGGIGTGLILQVHDSLTFRVKGDPTDASVRDQAEQIRHAMSRRYPGLPVTFTAGDVKAGKSWAKT